MISPIAIVSRLLRYAQHLSDCRSSQVLQCSKDLGRGRCTKRATTEYTFSIDRFGSTHIIKTPRCDDHPVTENVASTRAIEPPPCSCGLSALLASVREMGVEETPS